MSAPRVVEVAVASDGALALEIEKPRGDTAPASCNAVMEAARQSWPSAERCGHEIADVGDAALLQQPANRSTTPDRGLGRGRGPR